MAEVRGRNQFATDAVTTHNKYHSSKAELFRECMQQNFKSQI